MWEDSCCKAPIRHPEVSVPKPKATVKEKTFTAEWSDEYKMWVCYPILYYSDGRKVDASGQIIII